MRSSSEILNGAIDAATKTLQSVVDLESQVAKAADLIVDCLTSGKKILACGNGGSAADAADFCTELACRLVEDRRPDSAMKSSTGGSFPHACSNDLHLR